MKILIAGDHGGVELKSTIEEHLLKKGCDVENLGVDTADPVDYPDIAKLACETFLKEHHHLGILICGTGLGMAIMANKFPEIRCAVIHDAYTARMAREHNDANFLAFGGRVRYRISVPEMIDHFLKTRPSGGRHARRMAKISTLVGKRFFRKKQILEEEIFSLKKEIENWKAQQAEREKTKNGLETRGK